MKDVPKNSNTVITFYADGTAIMVNSKKSKLADWKIKHHLTKLNTYFTKWKIDSNTQKKTQLINFNMKNNTKQQHNIIPTNNEHINEICT